MPPSIWSDRLLDLLERSLSWRSRGQEAISGNLANLDTPNFTRKELNFQEILASHLTKTPRIRLIATHPIHLGQSSREGAALVRDTGEKVDLDREMVRLAENQLAYQATVQMLIKKLDGLRAVLEGDRR